MAYESSAPPLTPRGVERVKMLPAASGTAGAHLCFGTWIRRDWMGSGYLAARRLDAGRRDLAPRRPLRTGLTPWI